MKKGEVVVTPKSFVVIPVIFEDSPLGTRRPKDSKTEMKAAWFVAQTLYKDECYTKGETWTAVKEFALSSLRSKVGEKSYKEKHDCFKTYADFVDSK